MKTSPLVLGIMSGTSIDSVDYTVCQILDHRVRLVRYWQAPYPHLLRERLQLAAQGKLSCHEAAQLHHDLGRFYAAEATRGLRGSRPDLVGLHGQTIFHNPSKSPATLQLGEPAYLVEKLRVPVVHNFRAADLAAGGQGAPLATLFHCRAFARRGEHVCVNNLGGISNVTSIDWRKGARPRVMAFDTGPGNMPIDLAVRHFTAGRERFDRNGSWARRGKISEPCLIRWLRHPFFAAKPPKSTGREVFGEIFLKIILKDAAKLRLDRFDLLATLTELTARSIALNYRLHLESKPRRVILCGGGALNSVLVERFPKALCSDDPKTNVVNCEQLGWPVQSVEPAAFALLAYYRFKKRPANLPSTTGAKRPVLLGVLAEP